MKIFVVDDIKGWRDYHCTVLKNFMHELEFHTAESAKEGYDKLLENNETPFDIILTDMQMENDFEPKYAGEWFIERIKEFPAYSKTKIVIISAAYNISHIAEIYNVEYLRKSTARSFPDAYQAIFN